MGNGGRSLKRTFGFDAPLFADWRSDTSSPSKDSDLSSVEQSSVEQR